MKKLVTHSNGFHADDIMAYAILKEVLSKRNETWELKRSREPDVIADADIVFDVGEIYDSTINRYDHHQRGRAGKRENGILYAAAGLIWKHFGHELCSSEDVWKAIDLSIIASIDASDNGQDTIKESYFHDLTGYGISSIIGAYKPTIFEDDSLDALYDAFENASELARKILSRAIVQQEALEQAWNEAKQIYELSNNRQILVFDKNYRRSTWKRFATFPEPLFVVYPDNEGTKWSIEAVRKNLQTLESRKPFPESWRGLRAEELVKISGVADAHFCHPSGFLMGTGSRESAIMVAKMITESQ